MGVAAHSFFLDTEQLISHTRTAPANTFAFHQGLEGGMIAASYVYELFTKIHDILHNVMSKQAGNTTHILSYLFNAASRNCHEVWTSQFPLLHNIKDTVQVRLAFMDASTSPWHRPTTNPPLDYSSTLLL